MPPGTRAARQRVENDENSTRPLTRAKTAALGAEELVMPSKGGALQPKRSATNLGNTAPRAKRNVLGDMSNVNKLEPADGKKIAAKVGLTSKAHPTGVHKSSARPAARAPLAAKEPKKSEVRRPGPAPVAGPKRKVPPTSSRDNEDAAIEETQPVRKRVHKEKPEEHKEKSQEHFKEKPQELFKEKPRELFKEKPQELKAKPRDFKEKAEDVVHDENETRATVPRTDKEKVKEPHVVEKKVSDTVGEIDKEDWDDPLMVAEYATDIFEYMRDLETRSIPNPEYMEHQDDLEWKTRGILIDWLIEVHTRFHLLPETLFLAVNIIDRFLSQKVVQLDRLQLVGITAMFIASKYEEVLSPHVENFKRITDNGFSEAEILSAERFLLTTLNYDLSYPNPMNFLRRVSKADNYDIQSRTIGKYLMEISLLDHRFMAYRPSHCAAAAMYLARMMLDRGAWDDILTYYAGYDKLEVQPLVDLMIDYLARPVVHEAFFKKYASKKFLKASILSRSWAKKNATLFGITDTELSLDQIS